VFFGWYSANRFEHYLLFYRMQGPNAWSYWALIFCNGLAPQVLWFRKVRTSLPALFIVSIIVSIGMWLERFVIIVLSLERDFLPSSWGQYKPSWVDIAIYVGSFGLFFTLFLLFVRFLPSIAIAEMRELLHHKLSHGHHGDDAHGSHDAHGNPAHSAGTTPTVPATQGASH
jgi:molybdopterin-containing oxidoreductase family membrane subunit